MAIQNVTLVRSKATNELIRAVQRFRIWLSCVDGNGEAVDSLKGGKEAELIGTMVELTLEHCGHATEVTSDQKDARSYARRAVNKRI